MSWGSADPVSPPGTAAVLSSGLGRAEPHSRLVSASASPTRQTVSNSGQGGGRHWVHGPGLPQTKRSLPKSCVVKGDGGRDPGLTVSPSNQRPGLIICLLALLTLSLECCGRSRAPYLIPSRSGAIRRSPTPGVMICRRTISSPLALGSRLPAGLGRVGMHSIQIARDTLARPPSTLAKKASVSGAGDCGASIPSRRGRTALAG